MKLKYQLTVFLSALFAFSPVVLADDAFNVQESVQVCISCHGGEDGIPINQETPIIAGQEYYYLYVQLKDYKAGRRANPIMSGMVQSFSRDNMKELAEYFSTKPWPRVVADTDDSKIGVGETALVAGQCSQCHSTYKGDSRVPRLAGQHLSYLQQTMSDFKHKVRLNSPAKGSLMDSYEEEALEGMAHYLSGL